MWMVDRQHQVAELRLNPPELGRLDVRISMSGSEASVQFSAHSGAVREAVEQALPRLREMLEQNGLSLAHADVSDHGPREGEREQGETRPMPRAGLDTSPEAEPDGPAVALRMHEGLLDRYA
jgi:flagellar hook-length control protein FliK